MAMKMKAKKGKAMPFGKAMKGKPGASAPSGAEYPEGKMGGGKVTDRGKKK